jgi:hypothetical protein
LETTEHELAYFATLFGHRNQHRSQLLQRLYLRIVLPKYGGKYFGRFEREQDFLRNNQAFSDAILRAFSILQHWDREGDFFFAHMAYSPSDSQHSKYATEAEKMERRKHPGNDIGRYRYRNAVLTLERFVSIPSIKIITHFQLLCSYVHHGGKNPWYEYKDCGHRTIDGRSATELACQMPNIRAISWALSDNEKRLKHAT